MTLDLKRHGLVVCGGVNWNPADRFLALDDIHPVVVLTEDGPVVCPWFDRFRESGVGCLLFENSETALLTTGADLLRLDIQSGQVQTLDAGPLDDVHELTRVDGRLLIANTGRDEVISFDLQTGVASAHSVTALRSNGSRRVPGRATERFHLNQAFLGEGGELLALVHHTEGFHFLSHARRRLVRHGSGGILDIRSGWRKDLRLFAPHNVRRVKDEWLVLDSGRHEILRLNSDWVEVGRIPLSGWGRGAAVSADGSELYVGISATRRRYATRNDKSKTGLDIVTTADRSCSFLPLSMMEQVNSVEHCSAEQASALTRLRH